MMHSNPEQAYRDELKKIRESDGPYQFRFLMEMVTTKAYNLAKQEGRENIFHLYRENVSAFLLDVLKALTTLPKLLARHDYDVAVSFFSSLDHVEPHVIAERLNILKTALETVGPDATVESYKKMVDELEEAQFEERKIRNECEPTTNNDGPLHIYSFFCFPSLYRAFSRER